MQPNRLQRQVGFILEIDQLKSVLRQSWLINGIRRENAAEHSWHVALLALILAEYANEPVNLPKVLKMLLIHDLVEIDAGDSFVYDQAASASQAERERRAAERIFGLLPEDQAEELRTLWEDYETGASIEARFALALDHFMPLLHNFHTEGRVWQAHSITEDRVLARNAAIAAGSTDLWDYARALIEAAVARGYLFPAPREAASGR